MKVMQMFLQFYNYKPNTKSPNSLLIGFSEQRKNVNVISKKTRYLHQGFAAVHFLFLFFNLKKTSNLQVTYKFVHQIGSVTFTQYSLIL